MRDLGKLALVEKLSDSSILLRDIPNHRAVNWLLWPVKFKLAAPAASTSIVFQLIYAARRQRPPSGW